MGLRGSIVSSVALMACTVGICASGQAGVVDQAGPVGFDWSGSCEPGAEAVRVMLPDSGSAVAWVIPAGVRDLRIDMASHDDLDLQLIEADTGLRLVASAEGMLGSAEAVCAAYGSAELCYSGYDGAQVHGGRGYEWIELRGESSAAVSVIAVGSSGSVATVQYRYQAGSSCNERGAGNFEQRIAHYDTVPVGVIPAGKVNVRIELRSDEDVDIQLYDGLTPIVDWPDGLLAGAYTETVEYADMIIRYSGYNGDGSGAGHEYIEIHGVVTMPLTMKAFGFASGDAEVRYRWGAGTGEPCGGDYGDGACSTGLMCKQGDAAAPGAGELGTCHTKHWCESEASAPVDCAPLRNGPHLGSVHGLWGCQQYQCVWRPQ